MSDFNARTPGLKVLSTPAEMGKLVIWKREVASVLILGDLWTWWVRQMTDLARTMLPGRGAAPVPALVIGNFGSGAVSLLIRRRRHEELAGRFALDKVGLQALGRRLAQHGRRTPIMLRMPVSLLLERELDLPLAAESGIEDAIRFNIDTLTPFAAEELFWNWVVLQRDRSRNRLYVRLSLVRKTEVQPLIAALDQVGARPKLLEFALSDAETRTIALAGASRRGNRVRQSALSAVGGFVVAAMLTVAVLTIARDARGLAVTEAEISSLQPRMAEVERLRRRLADDAGSVDVVTRERAQVGDALQLVAIATEVLPDDTYLTDLSLHQRKLRLIGESKDAAKLIVKMSAQPMLRNTEFSAPVTRAPAGGRDVFSIDTEAAP